MFYRKSQAVYQQILYATRNVYTKWLQKCHT